MYHDFYFEEVLGDFRIKSYFPSLFTSFYSFYFFIYSARSESLSLAIDFN